MRECIDVDRQRRYWDAIAAEYQQMTTIRCDDFHYGPQIPGEAALRLLPDFAPGATALELGCGGAQNSLWLSARGLTCTALDASEAQLEHARMLASISGVTIRFLRAELECFRPLLGGERYDFVHSSHALEFVEHPAGVVRDMAACLKPGGTLMLSTVHPLFNGQWVEGQSAEGAEDGEDVFTGSALLLTRYFQPPDDVRDESHGHVISRAHPLSNWFRWLRDAGLEVTALEEPAAVADAPYTSEDWASHDGQLDAIPSTVIFVARSRETAQD